MTYQQKKPFIKQSKKRQKNSHYLLFLLTAALLPLTLNAAISTHANVPPIDTSPATEHVIHAPISEQRAISVVFNKIEQYDNRIVVNNRHHTAKFDQHGVSFTPTQGPNWHWSIKHNQTLVPQATLISPVVTNNAIDYAHKDYTERYLLKPQSIEQRFIIDKPWQAKHDLVIDGKINSSGQFETTDAGWLWRNKQGVVSLGQVTVFDADGTILRATMQTGANYSSITVAASELASAHYPVTIDPEIGSNDIRLSDMGDDGDTTFGAFRSAVAYNATNNEYLVVWYGDDNSGALVNAEYEIYGQRVNAATGAEIGGDIRLSDMGDDGKASSSALNPAVAYNVTNNEYLVVWDGDDNSGALVNGEYEIYGQRVNAATGAEIGGDTRLSDMGDDGNAGFDALSPAVAYNATNNEYLVVWFGHDNSGALVNGESEIYGQRVNAATGDEIGGDTRLSDMGDDGYAEFDALNPAVAYNATNNEYLVVWDGDDNSGALVDGENEIYGQRVNAATGAEIGGDIRLSDTGDDGDVLPKANHPAVAYNATNNEYLVVWQGDDRSGTSVFVEFDIYGQRVNAATGAEIGGDTRLSDKGDDGDATFNASHPAVAYNVTDNEYLVVWSGDDNSGALVEDEREIYGQRINAATGAEVGGDTRLSDMGDDGKAAFDATYPAVAYNATNNEYLVVWEGDDNSGALVNDEREIYGQRFAVMATLRFFDTNGTVAENVGTAQVVVQRVGDMDGIVTVDFSATNGTAIAPTDYTAATGTLTFNAGDIGKLIFIDITDNSDIDGDKTINLSLSNAQTTVGEVVLDAEAAAATLTIVDDEEVAVTPTSTDGGSGSAFSLLTLLILTLLISGRSYLQRFVVVR